MTNRIRDSWMLAFLVVALALFAAGCRMVGYPGGADALASFEWQLVELGGEPVELEEAEQAPYITFDAEKNQAEGYSGCNNFFGSYALEGSALKFGTLGGTLMACPGHDDDLEMRFLAALRHTRAWRIKSGKLQLLASDVVVARFKRAP
ncbi:MAG: META domain-containing protein [bacterium]